MIALKKAHGRSKRTLVMMSEMVFFHFGEVLRELRVMQCVVHAIVQDVWIGKSCQSAIAHLTNEVTSTHRKCTRLR
jgi:hypothetical protein